MFGFHVEREWAGGKRPGLAAHLKAARAFSEKELPGRPFAFQVFVAGPRQMKFTVDIEEARELREALQQLRATGLPAWGVAHGTYMDMPWDATKPNHKWTLKWIRLELRRAALAGLAGLVVHLHTTPPQQVLQVLPDLLLSIRGAPDPGGAGNRLHPERGSFLLDVLTPGDPDCERHPGPPDAILGGARAEIGALKFWSCHIRNEVSLRPLPSGAPPAQPDCARVYLEVPAVLPKNSHYETPDKLAVLFRGIRKRVDPFLLYFGLCIDTAHIWASGADIASFEAASAWLDQLERAHGVIPPHAIIFHLNDNYNGRGSGKDEHAPLFMGAIWGSYADRRESSGLAAFLDYARRHNVPTILERKAHKPRAGVNPEGSASATPLTTTAALKSDLAMLAALGC